MSGPASAADSTRHEGKLAAFARRLHEGLNPSLRARRSLRDAFPYDPETQYPIIRASICTGERVAGFRNRTDRRFTEVMLIRSMDDEREFMEAYGLDSLETEY